MNDQTKDILCSLLNLRKKLRSLATKEYKCIGDELTRYEGMKKGLYLGYEYSANEIDSLIRKIKSMG